MENEEVIRENVERTRESLTEKLEALENKVVGSIHEATDAVRETVTNVKETMNESVETVKEAVDVQAHVERHPWLMFGGAVLGGYVAGTLVTPSREPSRREYMAAPPTQRTTNNGNGFHRSAPQEPPAAKSSGFLQMLEPEIRQVKELALGLAIGLFREMIAREVPTHLADEVRGIIDGVTRKVGGAPMDPADVPFRDSPATQTSNL